MLLNHLRIDAEYATESEVEAAKIAYEAALAHVLEACGLTSEECDDGGTVAMAVLEQARLYYDNPDGDAPESRLVREIIALNDANLL